MNFYKHYLGDYSRKTGHLSLAEHGAYRRLLDHYYGTGKSLPAELDALCRVCGAISTAERQAVSSVADEYFPVNGDGRRHNRRADEELKSYDEKATHSRENGKLGGRPRITQQDTQQVLEEEPRNNLKPEVRSQKLEVNKPERSKALSGRPDVVEVLDFLNEKSGRHYKPVKANIDLISARLKEGATVQECRQVIAKKCRDWRNNPDMEQYLRPATLFNRTKFAQYQGEISTNPEPPNG